MADELHDAGGRGGAGYTNRSDSLKKRAWS